MSEHQPVPRVVPILDRPITILLSLSLLAPVVSGVGGGRAQASCGRRYTSPLIIMAQMTRAILLASATAASFFGLRASNPKSHGEARPLLARWMTAVAPSTSSRRRLSSPSWLILPGRCLPAVEFSRGVIPIHAAKCRAERKALASGILSAKLTPAIGPTPGMVARH
jgi:hypothetical protein